MLLQAVTPLRPYKRSLKSALQKYSSKKEDGAALAEAIPKVLRFYGIWQVRTAYTLVYSFLTYY